MAGSSHEILQVERCMSLATARVPLWFKFQKKGIRSLSKTIHVPAGVFYNVCKSFDVPQSRNDKEFVGSINK
jgi:hypothetical protein